MLDQQTKQRITAEDTARFMDNQLKELLANPPAKSWKN
jgi:hypothetical protein